MYCGDIPNARSPGDEVDDQRASVNYSRLARGQDASRIIYISLAFTRVVVRSQVFFS